MHIFKPLYQIKEEYLFCSYQNNWKDMRMAIMIKKNQVWYSGLLVQTELYKLLNKKMGFILFRIKKTGYIALVVLLVWMVITHLVTKISVQCIFLSGLLHLNKLMAILDMIQTGSILGIKKMLTLGNANKSTLNSSA